MKKRIIILFVLCCCLFLNNVYAYETYKIGDEITYNGNKYYVVENSDNIDNYVALLKANPLTRTEINKYINEVNQTESIGHMTFYKSDEDVFADEYDETKIKQVVDTWSNSEFGDDLVTIDGYKARLLSEDDLVNLGYSGSSSCGSHVTIFHYGAKGGVEWSSTTKKCNNGSKQCYTYYEINGKNYHTCTLDAQADDNGDLSICTDTGEVHSLLEFLKVLSRNDYCYEAYSSKYIYDTSTPYDWMTYSTGENYWTMMKKYVDDRYTIFYYRDGSIYYSIDARDKSLAVRPVVNVRKKSIGNKTDYQIGDVVTYNGEKYNVIYNSTSTQDYVTLLKYRPLTDNEINKATGNDSEGFIQYYSSNECNSVSGIYTGCTNEYSKSSVKTIIDKWYDDNINSSDKVVVKGYKARLLTIDELVHNFGYEYRYTSENYLAATNDTPKWIYDISSGYWIMDGMEDNNNLIGVVNKNVSLVEIYKLATLRPVIYLSKCGIGDPSCEKLVCKEGTEKIEKIITYTAYKLGTEVTLNGEKYYVLKNSSEDSDTVTLLKGSILTEDEINKYSSAKSSSKYGETPFYYSDKCYYDVTYTLVDDDDFSSYYQTTIDSNTSECYYSYEVSNVKDIIEKWASDSFDENTLKEVDGYKVRLFTLDELIDNYGFVPELTGSDDEGPLYYTSSNDTPSFIKSYRDQYWTMSSGDNLVYIVSSDTRLAKSYEKYTVVPVINVDKCAVDGGCIEEEVITGCDELESIETSQSEKVVHVDNTLSVVSKIGFIVGSILIISGLSILGYNYIHRKK